MAKFKREKQMKKKLEMDSKKPAFKVGVYRLEDSKLPPLHVGGRASMVNSSKVGTVMPSTSKSSSTFDIKKKRKLGWCKPYILPASDYQDFCTFSDHFEE